MSKVSSRGKISEASEGRGKKASDDDRPSPIILAYNLGSLGVDLVRSPIQCPDGTLDQGQNVQTSTVDDELSLRTRDGMGKVNALATNGPVHAIFAVPLGDS